MKAYGELVKNRAKRIYDGYIHLPVELDIVSSDSHHPMSDEFRLLSDRLLQDTIKELDIPMLIVGGSSVERVVKVIEHFDLPQVMNINDAVAEAERRVEEHRKRLDAEEQKIKKQIDASLKRQLAYTFRS